jgi:hypothetical protein
MSLILSQKFHATYEKFNHFYLPTIKYYRKNNKIETPKNTIQFLDNQCYKIICHLIKESLSEFPNNKETMKTADNKINLQINPTLLKFTIDKVTANDD